MRERVVKRYSEGFKRQVVADLESGRFGSLYEAKGHYGIINSTTINSWLKRYGKNHLLARVIRVEKPEEADQLTALQRKVAALERALGQTQAENLLNAEYLKLACEQMGQEAEAFKKKCVGKRSIGPTGPGK